MRVVILFLLAGFSLPVFSQESPYARFGSVTAAALQTKRYAVDSLAPAVVLSDIGHAAIAGNSKGWFSVLTTHHRVIHILHKDGYAYASMEIPLYTDGTTEERLEMLQAVTYNLERGKVVASKLEKSHVFTEKQDRNHYVKKFTLPNVKEGSIIEIRYRVASDFVFNIEPWVFQGTIPRLWSEFRFAIPQFFSYSFLQQGSGKLFIREKKDRAENFIVRYANSTSSPSSGRISAGVTEYRWVMKDVPALKEESFISTPDNHIARIEFQLVSQNAPLTPVDYRSSWQELMKELLEAENFGGYLRDPDWLTAHVNALVAGAKSDEEKAKTIYRFVRDGFACTDDSRFTTDQSMKAVFQLRKGSVAEINLLLTAMLRQAGIRADPVLLSQTDRGYVYEKYPVMSRFNYVIVRLALNGREQFLDATHSGLGFGRLLPDCYNGHARVVNEEAMPLYLVADSLTEKKVTVMQLKAAAPGLWVGSLQYSPGYFESYLLRSRILETGQQALFQDMQQSLGPELAITRTRIDSLSDDENMSLTYELQYKPGKAGLLYINPLFGAGYKSNPLTSAKRLYPVEMPYAIDETYVLTMEVPEDYLVDELPKQLLAQLDAEGASFFEYRIQQEGSFLMMRSRIKLAKAYYEQEEYGSLRDFFNLVVKKHAEQIVLKRKE